MPTHEFLPIELVFNPNWWYHAANISFDESFYFDADTRIKNDVVMRQTLHQRFGNIGLGTFELLGNHIHQSDGIARSRGYLGDPVAHSTRADDK